MHSLVEPKTEDFDMNESKQAIDYKKLVEQLPEMPGFDEALKRSEDKAIDDLIESIIRRTLSEDNPIDLKKMILSAISKQHTAPQS